MNARTRSHTPPTPPARPDNEPRFQTGTDHVESWFMRANHPTEPKALWLKATIFSESAERGGGAVAEAWCSLFDATDGKDRALGFKETIPYAEAMFSGGDPLKLGVGTCTFDLDPYCGGSAGKLGDFEYDLRWERLPGPLGDAQCMLPTRKMVDFAVPKNKLLTPAPALMFNGWVKWGGETWKVDRWIGMQGHNWGPAHSPEYAWGQCNFTDSNGDVFCTVEGASGRIVVGGRTSPILSLMTIRRGDREYRFNKLVDLWNQEAHIAFPQWSLKMKGRDGEALLTMKANPARMVCLGYMNPGGNLSYCLNSKLAEVTLRVNPVNEDAFTCYSKHGGALEFLQGHPAPELPDVV